MSCTYNGIACVSNSDFHLVGFRGAAFVHTLNSLTEGSKRKFFYFQWEFNIFSQRVYNNTPCHMVYTKHFQLLWKCRHLWDSI